MVPSKYIPKLRIKILYSIQNLRHLAFNEKGVCYSACNFGPLLQAANISCLMTYKLFRGKYNLSTYIILKNCRVTNGL